jgi:PhzF family phenazine biosynthesis protein
MTSRSFVLVDVFARRRFAGNPLAVFPDSAALDEGTMQEIAREFGYSETTFVLPPRRPEATWRLRCFTPTAEVFGAGHNALGAWWVLASIGRVSLSSSSSPLAVFQELGERILAVEISQRGGRLESISMTQDRPVFGRTLDNFGELSRALGISESELGLPGLRPQAVSTGATHLLVPVAGLDALTAVQLDADRLLRLVRPLGCQGAYLFTLETRDAGSSAHARAFFPGIGIQEDPATGSAAGPLGALLSAHDLLPPGVPGIIEQGDEIQRPSRIEVRVTQERVQVGGACVIVAQGELQF